MFVKIIDGSPVAYSIRQLRLDNPQVSFPREIRDETLAEYDVYPVADAPPPEVASNEQAIAAPPALIDGVWTRQWSVIPKPVMVPPVISDRQFFHALAKMNVISEQEALAAVATGTIPQAMSDIVEAMPVDSERFDAKMFLSGAVEFRRDHALVAVFGAAMGWTDAQIDDLFIFAGAL
jgi:hypothetical protein